MTWLRAIGAGVTSVRACFLGVSWASALPVALTRSMEAETTSCRTSQAILGNTIGGGAIDAQGCSSPETQRLDGAQHAAVTSISPAVTIACRLPAVSPTGSGATDARACSSLGTQVLGSAQQAADTTTQAAGITASLDRRLRRLTRLTELVELSLGSAANRLPGPRSRLNMQASGVRGTQNRENA